MLQLEFLTGSAVKNLPAMQEAQEMQVQSLGQEDPQKRKWQPIPVSLPENPVDRKACGLQSSGSQRVGND